MVPRQASMLDTNALGLSSQGITDPSSNPVFGICKEVLTEWRFSQQYQVRNWAPERVRDTGIAG
jgi:hypothetical protein